MDTAPHASVLRAVRAYAPDGACCAACGALLGGLAHLGRELLAYTACGCGQECAVVAHAGGAWVVAITPAERPAFTARGTPGHLPNAWTAARVLGLVPDSDA